MLYNVSQLLMDPTGSIRRFELNERLGEEAEGPFAAMASGTVRLLRTHQGLLLMATLEVESDTECARCLAGVARVATLDLEEECYPTVDPSTGRRMYPSDVDEGALHIDMNQMLDLSDVLRQYLLTSEPLRALCRQDCRGLCQECGADLNDEECRCGEQTMDPRWGALANLLSEDNS